MLGRSICGFVVAIITVIYAPALLLPHPASAFMKRSSSCGVFYSWQPSLCQPPLIGFLFYSFCHSAIYSLYRLNYSLYRLNYSVR